MVIKCGLDVVLGLFFVFFLSIGIALFIHTKTFVGKEYRMTIDVFLNDSSVKRLTFKSVESPIKIQYSSLNNYVSVIRYNGELLYRTCAPIEVVCDTIISK